MDNNIKTSKITPSQYNDFLSLNPIENFDKFKEASQGQCQEIQKDIIEFMKSFRKKDIVAMYDPRQKYEVYWVSAPFSRNHLFQGCYVCYDCDKCNGLKLYYFNNKGAFEETTISDSEALRKMLNEYANDKDNIGKNTGKPLRIEVAKIKGLFTKTTNHCPPDEYRIQLHFCCQRSTYDVEDEKNVLYFFKKYLDQGPEIFSFFEKIFIQLICNNLKTMGSENFRPVNGNKDQYYLDLDSTRREEHICKEISEQDLKDKEDKDKDKVKDPNGVDYKKLHWLTLNRLNKKPDEEKEWDNWGQFYKSLEEGFGTIGFDDYVTGITVRGAMTTITGQLGYRLARPQSERFKDKKNRISELLPQDDSNIVTKLSTEVSVSKAQSPGFGSAEKIAFWKSESDAVRRYKKEQSFFLQTTSSPLQQKHCCH